MDEVRGMNKIEANLPQDKIDFINDAHQKELQHWKRIVLESKNENDNKQLKNQYLPHSEERGTFIEDIPSQEDRFTFEAISDSLKTLLKSIKESENISFKNKVLLGGWTSTAAKVLRRDKNVHGKNLLGRFEDSMYNECGIKKQTTFNYKNLYKLMRSAPKLKNYRVNMTHLVKNHGILINYFEGNKEQSWKHSVSCDCEACNSYFTEKTMTS